MSMLLKVLRARWVALVAWLPVGGCWANFERNLDIALAPDAFENALRLPFSNLAEIARFVLRFV